MSYKIEIQESCAAIHTRVRALTRLATTICEWDLDRENIDQREKIALIADAQMQDKASL
jgi:hypothetical protein